MSLHSLEFSTISPFTFFSFFFHMHCTFLYTFHLYIMSILGVFKFHLRELAKEFSTRKNRRRSFYRGVERERESERRNFEESAELERQHKITGEANCGWTWIWRKSWERTRRRRNGGRKKHSEQSSEYIVDVVGSPLLFLKLLIIRIKMVMRKAIGRRHIPYICKQKSLTLIASEPLSLRSWASLNFDCKEWDSREMCEQQINHEKTETREIFLFNRDPSQPA